jgi:hypothetical protein
MILTKDIDSTYITFQDSVPVLNPSIKDKIRENLQSSLDSTEIENRIGQINSFLEDYWAAHPELHGSSAPLPPAAKAKGRAIKKDASNPNSADKGSYGGSSAINGLLEAMIHPTDIFITAANVLSTMGSDGTSYIDSINAQIDTVLQKAAMTDSIDINFVDYVGENSPISSIELYIATKGEDLPFEFEFKADFVGADGDSIRNIFTKSDVNLEDSPSFEFTEKDASSIKTIVEETKYVKFSVKCLRTESINQNVLRTLSQKGISFSVRVRVQSAMSKLTL